MNKIVSEAYGKWILAGEHAVLRGCPALAFPLLERQMRFEYQPTNSLFELELAGPHGEELQLIVFGLLEKALQKVHMHRDELRGRLRIESNLPLGAGMGGSAALCVGITRVLSQLQLVKDTDIYQFARSIEDLFHGESSGVDIAVSMEGRGLRFLRGGERAPLEVNWQPEWYLSFSGKKGVTSEAVKRVKEMWIRTPERAEKIDQQMRDAVEKAGVVLTDSSAIDRVAKLAQALVSARDCFFQWGLCEGALEKHMQRLSENGALAVKPTGSGGGGYVLSLWSASPPQELPTDMIPLKVMPKNVKTDDPGS